MAPRRRAESYRARFSRAILGTKIRRKILKKKKKKTQKKRIITVSFLPPPPPPPTPIPPPPRLEKRVPPLRPRGPRGPTPGGFRSRGFSLLFSTGAVAASDFTFGVSVPAIIVRARRRPPSSPPRVHASRAKLGGLSVSLCDRKSLRSTSVPR